MLHKRTGRPVQRKPGPPHRRGPREDLDMASYGIVKVYENRFGGTYPDMAWEPKAAFSALADYYR